MLRQFLATLTAVLFLITASFAQAQEPAAPNYAAWEQLATQAEGIIQSAGASNARLEALRASVVDWRTKFQKAQGTNSTRIATLRDQIAALGPAPAEGATEAEDVAARRTALTEQLAELQAPALNAVEAYSRADAIVSLIDKTLRERQASELLRISPTPLNPANWNDAYTDGKKLLAGLGGEVQKRIDNAGTRAELRRNFLVIAVLVLIGMLLLGYGRRWVDRLPQRLSSRASEYARSALEFLVSLTQIIIPTLGVILLAVALEISGILGTWWQPILQLLPGAGLGFFIGRWLAVRMFPSDKLGDLTLDLPPARRTEARLHTTVLAALAAIHGIVSTAILPLGGFVRPETSADAVPMEFSEAAAAVLHFPLIVLGALVLFRLCQILRRASRDVKNQDQVYRLRIVTYVGAAGVVVSIVAPIAAAIGYINAANALLWPSIVSIGLVFILMVLQDFVGDLWGLIRRDSTGARDALVPVLIGFVLVLAALPLFALIWGARVEDLNELWTSARRGIALGDFRLSPTALLTFIFVFTVGYLLTRVLQGAFRTSILPKTKIDEGGQTAIVSGLGYLGIFLATLMGITSAGIDLSSLAIVAGALSVGIGFGLQNIVSNFVSGIILLVERPITVGDWIEVGARQGIVRRISVRSTRIETFDRTEVIVPNADLVSGQVVNYTRQNKQGRLIVPVGVAYGSDTKEVEAILRDIAEAEPTALINPPPSVLFRAFGPDSLNFEIRMILSDINQGISIHSRMNHEILKRFEAAGIDIPFTQRDIYIRNAREIGQPKPPARRPKARPDEAEATSAAPATEQQPRAAGDDKAPPPLSSGFEADDGDNDR
ncbi:DUF3772 domain-containing protein [Paracoccus pacificus]|uniref:DUF3772 domain-containing protein n=1 Tax=Paracoccus pacificus TaxID=1463598 RepID=A0ABW4RAN5_9RHOB